MESKSSSLLIGLVALVLGIPMTLIILLAVMFQDEEEPAATDCLGGTGTSATTGGDMIAPAGSFIKPVDPALVTFTSPFGERWGAPHKGIDLAGPIGTPIYAAADGKVANAGEARGFGQWVVLDHVINGQLFSTVYGHVDTYLVEAGQQVRAGQQIATIGNRGESTGPHLHFETWPHGHVGGAAVDPKPQYDASPAPGEARDSTARPKPPDPAPSAGGGADLAQALPTSAGSEQNMQIHAKRLIRALHLRFGDRLENLGGWRADGGGFNDHPSGQAVDVMIPDYNSGTGVATGDEVLNYVMANAEFFHVDYAIWRQTYYPAGGTPNKMEDRGSDNENHFNHVHITVHGGGFDETTVRWGSLPGGSGQATKMATDCTISGEGLGDRLAAGSVPAEFTPWIEKAGAICPQIKPSLLAAQLDAENGFRYGANAPVSQTGAGGPAQFMPGTWATYGKDYDGDGRVDINSIGDAVMAQGTYMCTIAKTIDGWIANGSVKAPNGRTELYLAGYNAGEGAVLSSGGFPAGSTDYIVQTRPYADKIITSEAQYRAINK
ncbi:peptidoglycan DD-metalloendopeptidase family protein [Rhodococcus sp. (in: high G+C Gram-positive bacteria)]|uniref:peptidoglycan DD-metalloendopeptidase family protein n=1 Tax=Rhodococcus sp. TaxID=1831 RepID=UPI003BB0037D